MLFRSEVKTAGRRVDHVCRAVRDALAGYDGDVAVMGFNPDVSHWFAKHAPHIVRGLVASEEGKQDWRGKTERTLALWRARPDFLAYDIRSLPSAFAARARMRGLPVLTWTVREADQEKTAMSQADQIIFEMPDARA